MSVLYLRRGTGAAPAAHRRSRAPSARHAGGSADRASLLNPVPVFGPEPGLNEVFRAIPAEAIKRAASGR